MRSWLAAGDDDTLMQIAISRVMETTPRADRDAVAHVACQCWRSWVAAPPMATLRLRKARWAGRVWLPVLPTLRSVDRPRAAGTIFVSGKWAVRSPCPRDQCRRVAE